MLSENFYDWLNRELESEGLPQRFRVANGSYSYPVPRNDKEAEIFDRIFSKLNPSYQLPNQTGITTFHREAQAVQQLLV
jgi:hypothetical protein